MKKAYSFDDVLLVPQHFSGKSRSEIDISTEISGIKLQIPLIAANMPAVCEEEMAIAIGKRGGLGIIHRMCSIDRQIEMVSAVKKESVKTARFKRNSLKPTIFSSIDSNVPETDYSVQVGAAIGIGEDWLERSQALISSGVDIICIDVAFFAQDKAHDIARKFTEWFGDFPLIVGNIATSHHVEHFNARNAGKWTTYKIGVGSGAACSTRIATGAGLPTFQSIYDCNELRKICGTKDNFIADGGHRNSGDCVKSLAAGADAIMLGSCFAGTDQAPGEIFEKDGQKFKKYFGNASAEGKKVAGMKIDHIEGVSMLTSYKGDVNLVIDGLIEGIRSGMSYSGAKNLDELREKAEFVEISHAGYIEGTPHGAR